MPATSDGFWTSVAQLAGNVAGCKTCLRRQHQLLAEARITDDYGLPQPGWVGVNYAPGGVVFILQNPSMNGIHDVLNEARYQSLLDLVREDPSVETYRTFADETERQSRNWTKWKHPMSKLVGDNSSKIAWLNVVKIRTPENADVSFQEIQHGFRDHLTAELNLLQPSAIVRVGSKARDALATFNLGAYKKFDIKLQGASNTEALAIYEKLKDMGAI